MKVFWIAHRELKSTFTTATGWMVLCGFLLVTGAMWSLSVLNYAAAQGEAYLDPYAASTIDLTDWLLGPWFGNVSVVLVLIAPALSMRLFSEELRLGTLELLSTSPIGTLEIVLGKFLGALGFVAVMLAATSVGPLSLFWLSEPDPGVIAAGYLGLFLLAAAVIAIGALFSAMTAHQITALVITFSVTLAAYLLGVFQMSDPDDWKVQLSLSTHVIDLFRGAVRVSDLAYFGGVTVTFLFATHQRLESFRWG